MCWTNRHSVALEWTRKLVCICLVHLAPIGRIGEDHVILVLFADILAVNLQGVGQLQVGPFDPVQDHIHGAQQIGERLVLHAEKGVLLKIVELLAAERCHDCG